MCCALPCNTWRVHPEEVTVDVAASKCCPLGGPDVVGHFLSSWLFDQQLASDVDQAHRFKLELLDLLLLNLPQGAESLLRINLRFLCGKVDAQRDLVTCDRVVIT